MSGNMRPSVFINKPTALAYSVHANQSRSTDVGKSMDEAVGKVEESLEPHLSQFGQRKGATMENSVFDLLNSERFAHNKSPLTEVRKG